MQQFQKEDIVFLIQNKEWSIVAYDASNFPIICDMYILDRSAGMDTYDILIRNNKDEYIYIHTYTDEHLSKYINEPFVFFYIHYQNDKLRWTTFLNRIYDPIYSYEEILNRAHDLWWVPLSCCYKLNSAEIATILLNEL